MDALDAGQFLTWVATFGRDVAMLAGQIGERNVPFHSQKLEEAAKFIETSFRARAVVTWTSN